MKKIWICYVVISSLFVITLSAQNPDDYIVSVIELGETKPKTTLVDLLEGDPNLSDFVRALKAADLVTLLQGKGPYTLLAPSNAAFAKLPPGLFESLLRPEIKQNYDLSYFIILSKGQSQPQTYKKVKQQPSKAKQ